MFYFLFFILGFLFGFNFKSIIKFIIITIFNFRSQEKKYKKFFDVDNDFWNLNDFK